MTVFYKCINEERRKESWLRSNLEVKEGAMNPYPRRSDVNLTQQPKYTPSNYQTNMGDSPHATCHHRKRRSPRHKSWYQEGVPISIHVGNRRSPGYHSSIQVTSADGSRFAALVQETLRMNPQDPLLMYVESSSHIVQN
jgi:hypothetical protein